MQTIAIRTLLGLSLALLIQSNALAAEADLNSASFLMALAVRHMHFHTDIHYPAAAEALQKLDREIAETTGFPHAPDLSIREIRQQIRMALSQLAAQQYKEAEATIEALNRYLHAKDVTEAEAIARAKSLVGGKVYHSMASGFGHVWHVTFSTWEMPIQGFFNVWKMGFVDVEIPKRGPVVKAPRYHEEAVSPNWNGFPQGPFLPN